MDRKVLLGVSLATLATSLFGVPAAAQTPAPADAQVAQTTYDIAAQDLAAALRQFGEQSDVNVLFDPALVQGRSSPALHGAYTTEQALARLLEGSGLAFNRQAGGGYVLTSSAAPVRTGDASGAGDVNTSAEILVIGSSTLNADIRRTEDDIQPYVVLDGEDIRRSGAVNLEDYLQSRLPMNSQVGTLTRSGAIAYGVGAEGAINLRGLGADETLVLVDGRRLPGVGVGGDFGQPTITGISPSAIERIEVLPSSAGGQYGGSATGGVINIILKRDYSGLDVVLNYGNTFDSDASTRELSLNWGGSFDNGHTRIALSAAFTEGTMLYSGNRDFFRNGARLQLANDPSQYGMILVNGRSICSTTGFGCNGAMLTLDDGTPLNATHTFIPAGYAGPASDGAQALVDNAGQFDLELGANQLWAAPSTRSFGFNIRRDFNDWLEGYVDYARNEVRGTDTSAMITPVRLPAASPYNPFQQDIYSFMWHPNGFAANGTAITEAITAGAIVRLPRSWSAALEYRTTTMEPPFETAGYGALSPVASGPFHPYALQDLFAHPVDGLLDLLPQYDTDGSGTDSGVDTYSVRLSGPIFTLPGGPLTATVLLEQAHEYLDISFGKDIYAGEVFEYLTVPPAERDTTSQYLEVQAPLISSENQVPWVHALDLMASVRRDAYETGFAVAPDGFEDYKLANRDYESTNYTVGLRYAPVEDITFRASYGTGYLPPGITQLYESPLYQWGYDWSGPIYDPLRGGTQITGDADGYILMRPGGGNADIKPELSTSLSYGFIFTPRVLDGLRVSVDVTELEKTDEIGAISPQYIVNHEGDFSDRIVRGPNLPDDEPGWAGPILTLDDSILNIGRSEMRAIDIQADYTFDTESWGDWRLFAVATVTDTLSREIISGEPGPEQVGAFDGPLEWRANFGADVTYGRWWLGWNAQYFDSYSVCYAAEGFDGQCDGRAVSQGSEEIPSQIYHDLRVSYQLTGDDARFSNTQLAFGIQNLFDESPPVLATSIASGGYSPYGDPRLRRFTLQLRTHF